MKKPELLAPAGSMDSLKAAVLAGCDAVYLAGPLFGARSHANNFSKDELKEAITYAHMFNVKVYITVNTLIYDNEVKEFMDFIDYIHKNNVDAIIIQDIGMLDLIRKTYPKLEIHASTQMHIHNLEGVKLLKNLNVKRVVLARETPIELIDDIKRNTNLDLEIFVHGALCMSYSGQCLMSSLIGGRSGNRGSCAQPCRQPYDLFINDKRVNTNKYLLSTKDLNTLDYIGKLIDIGVDSLKIEGRMKRPEYVYTVVSLYRKAIDSYMKNKIVSIEENQLNDLKKIFNRKFTNGFIFHEDNDKFSNQYRPNHIGVDIGKVIKKEHNRVYIKLSDSLSLQDGIRFIDKCDTGLLITSMFKDKTKISTANKGDIINIYMQDDISIDSKVVKTTDYNQLKGLKDMISNNTKKIKINGYLRAKLGEKLSLKLSDGVSEIEEVSNYIVESSIANPTTQEEIYNRINKLGNTIYELGDLDIDSDNNIFIRIKELNELRRLAVEKLNEKRDYKTDYEVGKYSIDVIDFKPQKLKSILVSNIDDYNKYKSDYDIIYVDDYNTYMQINDPKVYLKIPRVNEKLKELDHKLLVGELGSVYKYKSVVTDFSLNVTNSYSVALLHSLGVERITLSYEMDYNQIKDLINEYYNRYKCNPNLEAIVDSYPEVMISKYNLLRNYDDVKCGYLKDKFNNKYKIKIKYNLMYIYNFKNIKLNDDYYQLGINVLRTNKDI